MAATIGTRSTPRSVNGYMGLMTALVLSFAFPLTIIALPVLLMLFDRDVPGIAVPTS
jgi:hypothetical protein